MFDWLTWSFVEARLSRACVTASLSAEMTAEGCLALRSLASFLRAAVTARSAWRSLRLFWATVPEYDARAWLRDWLACVTWSLAEAFSAAVRPALSLARRAFAEARLASATATSRAAPEASAVARTSPAFTAWPAVASTVDTVQELAPVVLPVDEPVVEDEALATVGALPKASEYVVIDSTVPVAATWSSTSVTVAWLVRYWVAVVPPMVGPMTAKAAAPIPTTTRTPAPIVFQRIDAPSVHVRAARDGQPRPMGRCSARNLKQT